MLGVFIELIYTRCHKHCIYCCIPKHHTWVYSIWNLLEEAEWVVDAHNQSIQYLLQKTQKGKSSSFFFCVRVNGQCEATLACWHFMRLDDGLLHAVVL